MELTDSPPRLILMTLCIGIRCRGLRQSVGIWQAGMRAGLQGDLGASNMEGSSTSIICILRPQCIDTNPVGTKVGRHLFPPFSSGSPFVWSIPDICQCKTRFTFIFIPFPLPICLPPANSAHLFFFFLRASLAVFVPGRVPGRLRSPLVPFCMFPRCHCHFLALYPCERARGREMEREREARRKEERQGNKGTHADAGPISFTNMQMLLPL